eukprot:491619-Rhodomonas_salina.3
MVRASRWVSSLGRNLGTIRGFFFDSTTCRITIVVKGTKNNENVVSLVAGTNPRHTALYESPRTTRTKHPGPLTDVGDSARPTPPPSDSGRRAFAGHEPKGRQEGPPQPQPCVHRKNSCSVKSDADHGKAPAGQPAKIRSLAPRADIMWCESEPVWILEAAPGSATGTFWRKTT